MNMFGDGESHFFRLLLLLQLIARNVQVRVGYDYRERQSYHLVI